MTRDDIGKALDHGLQAAGMSRRGFVWRSDGNEFVWIVHLDRLPHGDRVAIDVGCAPTGQVPPVRRASDCPIVLHAENMRLPDDLHISRLLDLSSPDTDGDRAAGVARLGQALGGYITGHQTLREVQSAFAAGEFRSAFVSSEARELLQAGT